MPVLRLSHVFNFFSSAAVAVPAAAVADAPAAAAAVALALFALAASVAGLVAPARASVHRPGRRRQYCTYALLVLH